MTTAAELARRAIELQSGADARTIIGIVGQPGAGKSTLAALVAREIGPGAHAVPMDGYHLPNAELIRLGSRDRKGAPDTFDVAGFVRLLARLRDEQTTAVPYPEFDRGIDEPVPDAASVEASVRIVLVEGNYLLTDGHGWGAVRGLLDEVWYVELEPSERLRRLVLRHERFGMTHAQATAWAGGPDERNARLIESTRATADRIVVIDGS